MLIDPAVAAEFLDLDSQYGDKISKLASWVQSRAENIIGRKLDKDDYVWYLNGNGTKNVSLPMYPINSVSSVYIDTAREFADAEDEDNYHVYLDTGLLHLYYRCPVGVNIIKVSASAGYDTTDFPTDLEMAFYEAIQWNLSRLSDRAFGVLNQSTPDGVSMGYEMVLPLGVKRVFESHRDVLPWRE